MADGVPVSRCGPLCQHPGCWHTTTHVGHGQHKDTEYTRFLSELLLRKKELKRLQARDGLHSTHTSDGLPTLKVQSINQKLLEGRSNSQRRRSKTLPPLKISTRKCAGTVMQRYQESPSKVSTVNYVQMQLQVDQEALDSDLCSELLFSPVLLWRPGKKQRHPPPVHESSEISNRLKNEKIGAPNQSSNRASSSPPHPLPHPQHTHPPPTTHDTASNKAATHKEKERREIDANVRRIHPENLSGKKSPLLVKTTDLTEALPPQQSFESTLHNEGKDAATATPKHGKARHKLTSADAECFAYLGDIPPQVVAEILHQLRSESTSGIDGTTTKPPYSLAHHTHTKDKSQKAYQSTTQPCIPVPTASLPHNTCQSTSSNNPHVPASLAYELSTQKVLKPEPVRPRRKLSSFSRELSKRPLEVLRRRPGQLYSKQQVLEKIQIPKSVRNINEDAEENFTRESELSAPQQQAKRHSCQMHLPMAEIEPPTDLPAAGVHPRYQPASSADPMLGNPPTHHQHTAETRPSQVQFGRPSNSAMHMDDNNDNVNFIDPPTTTIEDGGSFQHRVPSTILLQLNTDTDEQYEAHPPSGFENRRSRYSGHVMLTPRHQLFVPKSTVVVCPFSEEASLNHELETRGILLKRRESALQSRERKSRESYRQQSAVSVEHEHLPPLPSVSPDYMLVGAHFADNNLVLVDKDGKIVHQLTDTEGESDANILAHLSELNIHTQTSIDQQRIESLSLEENHCEVEASKPGTGVKPPPPTALEHSRDSVGEVENNEQALLVHVPEVEEERQTEAELGDVAQEIEIQPIAGHVDSEIERELEKESQDEAQDALLTAKSEAENEQYRQVKAKLKPEDGSQEQIKTLPITEHEEDNVTDSKSIDAGANLVPTRESEETIRTDHDNNMKLQAMSSMHMHRNEENSNSKSEDGNGLDVADATAASVETLPMSTTEQCVGNDYDNSEENRVEGIAPVITPADSLS